MSMTMDKKYLYGFDSKELEMLLKTNCVKSKYINVSRKLKIAEEFFKKLEDKVGSLNNKTFLDFGCGVPYFVLVGKKSGLKTVGLDIFNARQFFCEIRKVIPFMNNVILYNGNPPLPFKDNSFDIIFCKASINKFIGVSSKTKKERIENRLIEFKRVIKNNGLIIKNTTSLGNIKWKMDRLTNKTFGVIR